MSCPGALAWGKKHPQISALAKNRAAPILQADLEFF
jgi:hypothetical protein